MITTSFVPFGENTALPLALNGLSVEIVTDPLNVEGPETERLLLTVVNPSMTPRLREVAEPPKLRVVAIEFSRLNVVCVVVRSPPLIAMSPAVVTFPVRVDIPSTVSVPFVEMFPALVMDVPVDPYPPPTFRTSNPAVARLAVRDVAFGSESVKLLIVAVPVDAPSVRVVEAPPIFRVVAVELRRLNVVWLVKISPPLTLRSPPVVISPLAIIVPLVEIFPFDPVSVKLAEVMSFDPRERALTISGSDRSRALVIPPADDWTRIPEKMG